jgi:SRSO17 transposase
VGKRATQGRPEEQKYFWSNLPAETILEELAGYAHRRHAIEQFHEEAKGELGWDQYQRRLSSGLHRHAVTVMLAYGFLVWLERRQRPHQTREAPDTTLFPLGRSPSGEHCRPCIVRLPGGCATKLCCSG